MIHVWRLETRDWAGVKAKKYGGDIFLNTYIDKFFSLEEVWQKLGFKLKKARCGYVGMKDNMEYILVREK